MPSEKTLTSHPGHVASLPSVKTFVVTYRRLGGVVSCGYVMKHYGILLRTSPGALHVAILVQRSRVPDAIDRTVVHRVRGLTSPEDIQPPMAQIEQAPVCFMRCADELDALIVLDAALCLGHTTHVQLEPVLPGPRSVSLRSPLSQACPGTCSLLEMIARHDLEQVGYRPAAAVTVDGVDEVDLALSRRPQAIVFGLAEGIHVLIAAAHPTLLIETDSYTYHPSRPDWHSDHLHDQAIPTRGHTPLRLTSDQIPDRGTVRIVSSVARRLGIHPNVTPGNFQVELERGRWEPLPYLRWSTPSSPLAGCQWLREKSPIVMSRRLLPRVGELLVEYEHVEESTHMRPRHPPQGAPVPAFHGVDAPGDSY